MLPKEQVKIEAKSKQPKQQNNKKKTALLHLLSVSPAYRQSRLHL